MQTPFLSRNVLTIADGAIVVCEGLFVVVEYVDSAPDNRADE